MRVLVADSPSIFRFGVRDILRSAGFEVVEASSLQEAVDAATRREPDVALIDQDFRPEGAVALVSRLARACDAHLIVWSFDPDNDVLFAAVRAGASGFLQKDISAHGLIRAIEGLATGEAAFCRSLVTTLLRAVQGYDEQTRARERTAVLSSRELDVLALIAEGARNRQIAGALSISEFTVKRHVQNMLEKLALPSRRAAASLYATAFPAEADQTILRSA
jgi:DNA-binding NarL/FixJ family response regulator